MNKLGIVLLILLSSQALFGGTGCGGGGGIVWVNSSPIPMDYYTVMTSEEIPRSDKWPSFVEAPLGFIITHTDS